MKEFRRWCEYDTIETIGTFWLVQQNAVLVSSVLNALRGKGGKRYRPADLLPKPSRPHGPKKLSNQELLKLHKLLGN